MDTTCVGVEKLLERGRDYLAKGAYEKAIKHLEKAMELDPDNTTIWHDLATAYSLYGHTARAVQLLKKLNERKMTEETEELEMQERKEEKNQLLQQPVNSPIEWSRRVRNCFKEYGIETIGDLVNKTDEELLKMKSFGKLCLKEVKDKLDSMELSSPQAGQGTEITGYSCVNCGNLITRTITREDLKGLERRTIQRALNNRDIASLRLTFPFSLTVYKRIQKYGEGKILYCRENLMKKNLYLFRSMDNIVPKQDFPCPKYK